MATYPQLILPKTIIEILKKRNFQRTVEPKKPTQPLADNNASMKIGLSIVGIIILFFKPLLGVVILILAILWAIKNPEKNWHLQDLRHYQNKLKEYEEMQRQYLFESNLSQEQFLQIKRKEEIKKELKKATAPSYQTDYKKGLTHNFFKGYLIKYFGENIKENCCLKVSRNYKNGEVTIYEDGYEKVIEKRPYITDFTYYDNKNNLLIAIEIDEPYTLDTKEPIHVGDYERNEFFGKHNWVTVRFAEEQIVIYPDLCCKLIVDIRTSLINDLDFGYPFTIKCDIPNIPSWTSEKVKELVSANYRQSYLKKYIS